ncbi:PadR family transcriptional regulator [Saccharothrix sp. NRRL B-16348]|jgi:DNA-binding PadR family transcriptional regulator|uniref:PadR family transcriptional regulator n=1 Tax=Saccharothrix sp. NRRL B-16348 TaxID=1415542 RepID=UPI0006AFC4B1|nr:PadR family transcriptional regulator [Saccharothrix sp. NRRL B-16348]KOX28748.1 PadR family transcriptional regulator [Saccharothrix sp. NRRL B-16348]
MALEHAILVSLDERSGSGYELAQRFEKSIGFFWAATHQQIYRTLKRMVGLGWVSCHEVAQDGRPDKKVYEVAEAGREELARWLAAPGEPETIRHDLSVKVRGASSGDAKALIGEVARHRDLHAERLDVYLAIEKKDFPDPSALSGRPLHQYLVLRGGIRAERALVEWCDEVLAAMREDDRR